MHTSNTAIKTGESTEAVEYINTVMPLTGKVCFKQAENKGERIYISGKITGLPLAEAESRFQVAETQLQQIGYSVINPLKIDHEHDKSWKNFMIHDIKALFDCTAIYMLNNWKQSAGARIEHAIAVESGMKILYQPN
jgi:adenine specific DNA methylase Mod